MAKHKVRVTLVAECEVEVEVEVEDGDEPTDLTDDDVKRAIAAADSTPDWGVDDVELVE